MIKLNNKNDNTLSQMYNILIENLFITYPEFLSDRDKHDNKTLYQKWINMIKTEPGYNIITYEEENKVLGFLNYQLINKEMWICEVQVKKENKNQGILKKLLNEFFILNKKYKCVTIHINQNNKTSRQVFTHIGFKYIGQTIYKINMQTLNNYLNNKL